jgi:hypothetical protein
MQFIASITRHYTEIQNLLKDWYKFGEKRNPLQYVLVTPLFTPKSTLDLIREKRESNEISEVWFDSGGYFVQMGRISYQEMYYELLNFYRENTWADVYVLPDYVPLSTDIPEDVWYKVKTTADMSSLFYSEIPDILQRKVLGVIQGHTINQIEYCLENYVNVGIPRVGFGSFGTGGKSSSVNIMTRESIINLLHIKKIIHKFDMRLHTFGVGTPPIIYLLTKLGVDSFDTIGWMKTAGYGKIYMPFVRGYNITYRDLSARGLQKRDFLKLKEITAHDCYFCSSFTTLMKNRSFRIMHNLAVILDTIELLGTQKIDVEQVFSRYAPYYANMLDFLNEESL